MDSIASFFGVGNDGSKKITLRDESFGLLTGIENPGNKIIWKGEVSFLGQQPTLFIHGSATQVDEQEKAAVLSLLANESSASVQIISKLKEEFDNNNTAQMLNYVSLTVNGTRINIEMEDKESSQQFNIGL